MAINRECKRVWFRVWELMFFGNRGQIGGELGQVTGIICSGRLHVVIMDRVELAFDTGRMGLMCQGQRRSQDFFFGGATRYIFVTSPGGRRIQWGGG